MASVMLEDQVIVPAGIETLEQFRRWTRSRTFPKTGRIDFIAGCIEVDLSPEEFFSHGGPKEAIARTLGPIVYEQQLGYLRIDNIRVASPAADLSCEPDVVLLSDASLDSGRVRMIPARRGGSDSCLELEGGPDLVVEVISKSSVGKDTRRLPRAYFAAGVRELWLIDARGERLEFQILTRGKARFRRVLPDRSGTMASSVIPCRFRFVRERNTRGRWVYTLEHRPLT